jgi:hypothetical protein
MMADDACRTGEIAAAGGIVKRPEHDSSGGDLVIFKILKLRGHPSRNIIEDIATRFILAEIARHACTAGAFQVQEQVAHKGRR